MSVKFGVFFLIAAILFAACATLYGGIPLILFWPSLSFGLVGLGYLGLGPRVFGKRADGSMSPVSVVLLLPFLLYLWVIWYALRLVKRESAYHELVPGVLIGRRLLPGEVPDRVSLVVDLTCEFPEPRGVRAGRAYLSFPILDGSVPALADLARLTESIRKHSGTAYIHCAEGHGRTGVVAAVLLLTTGKVTDAAEAVRMVQEKRPLVRLRKRQQRIIEMAQAAFIGDKQHSASVGNAGRCQ